MLLLCLSACVVNMQPQPTSAPPAAATLTPAGGTEAAPSTATASYHLPPTLLPGTTASAPTPDSAHYQPGTPRPAETYVVQSGDILSAIATRFGVSLDALVQANKLADPDSLQVGQQLLIPAMSIEPVGPALKLIPDSELVYGPLSDTTDVAALIHTQGGYLDTFQQDVNGETLDGAQIVLRVAQDYSINPRLLLALLEYRAGWVSNPHPQITENPFGTINSWYVGLYRQLAWAATQLNGGFYGWLSNPGTPYLLADGSDVPPDPTINAGTAGVQNFFAGLDDYPAWLKDVSAGGFYATYTQLFGNPFSYAIEPLVPADLVQPALDLPFPAGEIWSFTGGPHAAWDAGSPFGALDFAPPGPAEGCVESQAWVTAMADGVVAYTSVGEVLEDLDGEGNEGSGWVLLYLHVESRDRVQVGTSLQRGDHVGHPSCEGGIATGTNIHVARRFNGVWIAAAGPVPFVMDGWVPAAGQEEYDGTLSRDGQTIQAYGGNSTLNLIEH
jgi:LysM repeat protein